MTTQNFFRAVWLGLIAFLAGCSQSDKTGATDFKKLALQGERVFRQHECTKCHTPNSANPDSSAPDLSLPYLANNEMLVIFHLKSQERSKMPPIELTDEEILLLSYYIAGLHASRNATVDEKKADTHCPVCRAPVSIEEARRKNFVLTYLETDHYFECKQCLEAFSRVPEAFLQ